MAKNSKYDFSHIDPALPSGIAFTKLCLTSAWTLNADIAKRYPLSKRYRRLAK